jgi:exonuclease III
MLNILFWNVGKKRLGHLLAELVVSNALDLLILAENPISPRVLRASLNAAYSPYHFAPGICERIQVYTKFPAQFLRPTYESERISIRALSLPARLPVLVAMAHLPSKLHLDDDGQRLECYALAERLAAEESKVGHKNAVILGDLNVNPFEKSVASTFGLHAVMSKRVAVKVSRRVQRRQYEFFYNPMWRCFGDRPDGPPGTYYYEKAQHTNYFWNIYDQVLIRPGLINRFPDGELRILTSIGNTALVRSDGLPDTSVGSDHLPLFFKLDL